MFNSFTYQKPVVNYEQLMSALKDCPKDKIDEIVKEVNVSDEYILIEPMKGLFDED